VCFTDPDRASRGLVVAAANGDRPIAFWKELLWSPTAYRSDDTEARIAKALEVWPIEEFREISGPASSWLERHMNTLDETILWKLWDKSASVSLVDEPEAENA
jgi:hypothetical protein